MKDPVLVIRKLYQTLCDDNQLETVRAEAYATLLAVADVDSNAQIDWGQVDRIVRESGAAGASELTADVAEVSYGNGAAQDPINGRIAVTVQCEGTFTVERVHGPRRAWHGTLAPGAWHELLGAMELDGFPMPPKARVGLVPGTTFIDIAWRRSGKLEQIVFPNGTPMYRDVSRFVHTIVAQVDASLGVPPANAMKLVAGVQQEPIDPAVEADHAERAAHDLATFRYTTRRCLVCGGEFVVKETSSTRQVICTKEQRVISTRAIGGTS